MMITLDLDRKITASHAIMERLDSNQPLSSVLSQVRLLANMAGDQVMVAQIDILTHGLLNMPYQRRPFTDPAYKKALLMHMELCSMEDPAKLDINETVERMKDPRRINEIPVKNQVLIQSVYEMESNPPPPSIELARTYKSMNISFQLEATYKRTKSILITLKAYIYDYVSNIWVKATREKERIDLLGPDYRFITNKLDTLETPVGNELIATVDNLGSTNPAHWSLSALGCRNVVLKLATILWKVNEQTYITQSGKKLEVGKDKEKNRLYAYVDAYSKGVTPDKREPLEEAKELVNSIYNKGSKGKGEISHAEAQILVVDTFHLIDLLIKATELKPIDTLC